MKNETLKELQEALNELNFIKENSEKVNPRINRAIKNLNHAIFLETPRSVGKFNIYDWVSDDALRPVLGGIFHDNGFEVASDGHVLVCLKSDYEPELEGRIIDKFGESVCGSYPNYMSIKPKNNKIEVEVDTDKVYDALREHKARKKAAGKGGYVPRCVIRIGNKCYFYLDNFKKFCGFLEMKNNFKIKIEHANRAAMTECEDGSWALIMPLLYDEGMDWIIVDADKK